VVPKGPELRPEDLAEQVRVALAARSASLPALAELAGREDTGKAASSGTGALGRPAAFTPRSGRSSSQASVAVGSHHILDRDPWGKSVGQWDITSLRRREPNDPFSSGAGGRNFTPWKAVMPAPSAATAGSAQDPLARYFVPSTRQFLAMANRRN
jgi:hypothetical protein